MTTHTEYLAYRYLRERKTMLLPSRQGAKKDGKPVCLSVCLSVCQKFQYEYLGKSFGLWDVATVKMGFRNHRFVSLELTELN
jgi:hypothetical protein